MLIFVLRRLLLYLKEEPNIKFFPFSLAYQSLFRKLKTTIDAPFEIFNTVNARDNYHFLEIPCIFKTCKSQ